MLPYFGTDLRSAFALAIVMVTIPTVPILQENQTKHGDRDPSTSRFRPSLKDKHRNVE
jgi:hypothetical protein